jgi:hypothetical protein
VVAVGLDAQVLLVQVVQVGVVQVRLAQLLQAAQLILAVVVVHQQPFQLLQEVQAEQVDQVW